MLVWLGRMQYLYNSMSKVALYARVWIFYELRKTSEDPSEKMFDQGSFRGLEEKTREEGPSRAH
jgi:hypothetical protein